MEIAGLALNSVDYAIQIALLIKETVHSYHQNPTEYIALLSRFQAIRQSLVYLERSGAVDLSSPVWGSAFHRIRTHFDGATNELNDIYQKLSSNPFRKVLSASNTSSRIRSLEADVRTLQRDLDLLGFFTASTQTSASQSTNILSNVNDVQQSVANMEAQLTHITQMLNTVAGNQNVATTRAQHSTISETTNQIEYNSPLQRSMGKYNERRNGHSIPNDTQDIHQRIRGIQTGIKQCRGGLNTSKLPLNEYGKLKMLLKSFHERWLLDMSDITVPDPKQMTSSGGNPVYSGLVVFRDLKGFVAREALAAVTFVQKQRNEEDARPSILRQVFLLRKLVHPCILEFYGAYWPGCSDDPDMKKRFHFEANASAIFVSELTNHNLRSALTNGYLDQFQLKLRILRDIACAIEYLHSQGVVHSNLTLDNVLLRVSDGQIISHPKLGNLEHFALAQELNENVSTACDIDRRGQVKRHLSTSHETMIRSHPSWDTWHFGALICYLFSHRGLNQGVCLSDQNMRARNMTDLRDQHAFPDSIWLENITNLQLRGLAQKCLSSEHCSRPPMTHVKKTIEYILTSNGSRISYAVQNGEHLRKLGQELLRSTNSERPEIVHAMNYFHAAVQHGSIPSLVDLGNCYFYGHGIEKNESRAVELYRRAANVGYPSGQLRLGECFYAGVGAHKDLDKAVQLYLRAAKQGNVPAKCRLGFHFFSEASGNEEHTKLAVKYWKEAASSGHQLAQFHLAVCLEKGIGVSRDMMEARLWYVKSAAKGHFGAKWSLQRLLDEQVAGTGESLATKESG